ncbi:hypothetical protein RA2_01692 [Roseovarius sp. A-2]|uniref:hypothetical protein n=1 Tax=Roseovarius sp. A-2 TaxID=1570360 RepID=UPI0009B54972|nr:hypothetical protein [Roseovarius sp. A-2]GAW34640.1 hypothetical protein RA2_01692 [Roseovarius sp. A-2]
MKTLAQIRKIDGNSPDRAMIAAANFASRKALSARSDKSRTDWEREADRLAPLGKAAFARRCAEVAA